MSQVWTMKLTESTSICYASDRVACTTKMNVKETFMRNDSFRKCLYGEWTVVREQKTYLVFSKGRMDLRYSAPTLGNP